MTGTPAAEFCVLGNTNQSITIPTIVAPKAIPKEAFIAILRNAMMPLKINVIDNSI